MKINKLINCNGLLEQSLNQKMKDKLHIVKLPSRYLYVEIGNIRYAMKTIYSPHLNCSSELEEFVECMIEKLSEYDIVFSIKDWEIEQEEGYSRLVGRFRGVNFEPL